MWHIDPAVIKQSPTATCLLGARHLPVPSHLPQVDVTVWGSKPWEGRTGTVMQAKGARTRHGHRSI